MKSGKTEKRSPGSLGYKAPELIKCKFPFDGIKADIFSLGAILFNLVTSKGSIFKPIEKNLLYEQIESKDKKDIFQK